MVLFCLSSDDDDEASIALAIKLAQEEEDLTKVEKGKGDGGAAMYRALKAEASKPRSDDKSSGKSLYLDDRSFTEYSYPD